MKQFFIKTFILVAAVVVVSTAQAQDGKEIFESYCSACHKVDKRSTGPALAGAKQRWADNSSEENLYKWIKNSQEVLASGDSYANQLFKDYNESIMTPQPLSDEQIAAVLTYVDAPPVVEKAAVASAGATSTGPVEDYAENKKIFTLLLLLGVFMAIAIVSMSGTLKAILKSKSFKEKYAKSSDTSNVTKAILLLVGLSILPEVSNAMSFSLDPDAEGNFLMISRSDLWMMAIVDLVLLAVFFYLKNMVNSMLRETMSEKRKAKLEKVAQEKSVTQVLNDFVPIEEEESIMMDHEYDGIRELDNNLPPWWKWGFYITIVFAIVYVPYYHIFNRDGLQENEWAIEMAEAEELMKDNVNENTVVALTEPSDIQNGGKIFKKKCAVCHGQAGEGVVGPNLTDDHWLYEGDIKGVFSTIKYGTEKGMQSWSSEIPAREIQQISSYILTLPAVEGKAPEGEVKTYK